MPWIIDKDHIADLTQPAPSNSNAIGMTGPRDYKGDGSELREQFRIYYYRKLYYEGRCNACSLEPFHDFAKPLAGATVIMYLMPITEGRIFELSNQLEALIAGEKGVKAGPAMCYDIFQIVKAMRLEWRKL